MLKEPKFAHVYVLSMETTHYLDGVCVCEWTDVFRKGRTNVIQNAPNARPFKWRKTEIIQSHDPYGQKNYNKGQCTNNSNESSAHLMAHGILCLRKVCTRCVPEEMTEEHQRDLVDVSCRLLEHYLNESDIFRIA